MSTHLHQISLKTIAAFGLGLLVTSHNVGMYLYHDFWFIISMVNLVFHEAGHMFMMFFGELLHIFGGTLFEMSIPLLIAVHFYRRLDWLGVAFALWWSSTALMSIGIYASDATLQQLPLLGGDAVGHDWYNLLSKLDMLSYDQVVGTIFTLLSIFTYLGSVYSLWQYQQTVHSTSTSFS